MLAPPLLWEKALSASASRRYGACAGATTGSRSSPPPKPGDLVSLHWDFVCDKLTTRTHLALERATRRALLAVNGKGSRALVPLS